jgi:hypothetical protein
MGCKQPSFRRKLKNILKNWQREDMKKPEGYKLIIPKLKELGYIGLPYEITFILRSCTRAKGRAMARIGRAALKQGKYVLLSEVGLFLHHGLDARLSNFDSETELLEELYEV